LIKYHKKNTGLSDYWEERRLSIHWLTLFVC